MKRFRLLSFLLGLGLLAVSLGSCLREPSYSVVPEISFNSIQVIRIPPAVRGAVTSDSIRITINFQDGDGDLGLNSTERQSAPFAFRNADGTLNKFYNNYFIEPFVLDRATGQYQSLAALGLIPPGAFNGAFPRPTSATDNKAAPIKGTLTYALQSQDVGPGSPLATPGQTLRFEVTIADRALHVSNTITTDTIRVARL